MPEQRRPLAGIEVAGLGKPVEPELGLECFQPRPARLREATDTD